MFRSLRARITAPKPRTAGRRQFFLEREPLPGVLPGQGLPQDAPAIPEGKPWVVSLDRGVCLRCRCTVYLMPAEGRGLVWEHGANVVDGHEPVLTGEPQGDDVQALVADGPGALASPTPLADELRRDRELLHNANGALVARVRALEAQLRAAGIEPVRVE